MVSCPRTPWVAGSRLAAGLRIAELRLAACSPEAGRNRTTLDGSDVRIILLFDAINFTDHGR